MIDGDPNTEWLLPDGVPGWVEVRITPPEHVQTIRVLNSRDRPYDDRATRDYTIEVYSHGALARTIQGGFATVTPTPSFVPKAINVDAVDRIRLVVRSFHERGGGLAELEWD